MRFALVIEPPATEPLDRLAPLRLAIARAGFNVVRLRSGPALRRDLERAIDATEPDDAALVYIAGDLKMHGEDIALAAALPLTLAEMRRVVGERRLGQVLFVVDGRAEGEKGDAINALEHLEAIVAAISPRPHAGAPASPAPALEASVSGAAGSLRSNELLAAVESGPFDAPPVHALTRFFILALEDTLALSPDGTMRLEAAYATMKGHPEFAASVPSFTHVKGVSDFVIVAPVVERVSELPASRASTLPPSSIPPSMRAPRPRSVLPLPALEPILAEAERAHAKKLWVDALDGYRKALMVAGDGEPRLLASLYASIAEVKLAQGKGREAETSFEKALSMAPGHTRSLEALVKLAKDGQEWGRAAGYELQLARAGSDDAKRVEDFARAAELYERANDLPKAIEVLEEARAVRPGERVLLIALRAGYEALRQWSKAVGVLGALAEAEPLLHDKAQRRFEQADLLLGRLRDEETGLAALNSALEADPTHEKALAALVAMYTRRQEWRTIDALYAKLVEAYALREDVDRAWDVCRKLGQLRRDKLGDGPGALEAFTGAVKLKPKDVETRAALAELLIAKGDRAAAVVELEAAAHAEPLRAETYRRLFDLHRRLGATDRAWLAATALEALHATNVDQSVLADQFRGEGKPTAPLDDEAWGLLRVSGGDPVIEAILEAVAPAAIAAKISALRAEKKLFPLDPNLRQPPDSTATLVRTFALAGRILCVTPPDLYTQDDQTPALGGELAAVAAPQPSTLFGPSVMTGRKVPELVFLAARHLTYYRPEYYPLIFFPTLPELTALVLAAIKLARPELPLPDHPGSAALRRELLAHTDESRRVSIAVAVERLDVRGGKLDLTAWLHGVELTANRAGLLLAGDLAAALRVLDHEKRSVAELTFEDRRADLLGFTASRQLAELRMRIGVAARASLPPPPPSNQQLPV